MNEIIAWLVAGGGIALLLCAHSLKLRTEREQKLEKSAKEFYKNVNVLLNDPNMPAEAIDIIDFLNRHITNKSLARQIFYALLSRRLRPATPEKLTSNEVIVTYYTVERQDLLEALVGACVTGMLTIIYQSHFFGLLLRRLAFFDLKKDQRAANVVMTLRASGIGNGRHCAAPA